MTERFTWDASKRRSNLRKHGLDFADAWRVFDSELLTLEDARADYGEQRFLAIGFLGHRLVKVVYVLVGETVRLISMQEATRHEVDIFQNAAGGGQGKRRPR